MLRVMLIASAVLAVVALLLVLGCSSLERKLLFYPSHRAADNGLAPWTDRDGTVIGYSRLVAKPVNVWLMLHGNGGQASDRAYALPCFSADDAVFILEYPGYGRRAGVPSAQSFNAAARDAYRLLRATYPKLPVCVVGESIGSGPACVLANEDLPPAKLVLVVPFDRLSAVAREHFPSWLVAMVLKSDWDNVAALSCYRGPVDIFGASADTIIPVAHARALAAAIPAAKCTILEGGHNDWSRDGRVRIRNP